MVKRYMQPHKHKIKHVTEDVDYHFMSQSRLQMFLMTDQLVMRDKTIYCVMFNVLLSPIGSKGDQYYKPSRGTLVRNAIKCVF